MENSLNGIEEQSSSCGIKKIVDCKIMNGQQMYKVKWEPTWEPAENLVACQHLVDEFWSCINTVKVNEQKAKQHNKRIKLEPGMNEDMNYGQFSSDSKAGVQHLIARTNFTSAGSTPLISPSHHFASASSDPVNGFSAQAVKLEGGRCVKNKSPLKTELTTNASKSKTAASSNLKYLTSFDNPYVKVGVLCKICNKEQSLKHEHCWKRHYLTHSDQKPHQCPHCQSSFVQVDKWRKHVQVKHGDMMNQTAHSSSSGNSNQTMHDVGDVKHHSDFNQMMNNGLHKNDSLMMPLYKNP